MEEIEPLDFETLCPSCFSALAALAPETIKKPKYLRHLTAPFEQGGVAENLIEHFRSAGRSYLAEGLGGMMVSAWLEKNFPLPDLIIPVPASPVRSFKRGYQPSALLAETVANLLNRPVWKGIKEEVGRKEFYFVKDPLELQDKVLLLVDDICKTGSKLNASAEFLFQGYPEAIDGLTFSVQCSDGTSLPGGGGSH